MATKHHEKIEKIFSHPQAIAQGKSILNSIFHMPRLRQQPVQPLRRVLSLIIQISHMRYRSACTAKEYGLQILAKDIQEIEKNYTRFWVLGNTVPEIPLNQIDCKLTLALTLPDNMPGALYKALSTFAWRGIDLTKIESRPLKTVLGEYFFIIDCDYTKEKLAQFALEELTAVGIGYKILGAYQVYEI